MSESDGQSSRPRRDRDLDVPRKSRDRHVQDQDYIPVLHHLGEPSRSQESASVCATVTSQEDVQEVDFREKVTHIEESEFVIVK